MANTKKTTKSAQTVKKETEKKTVEIKTEEKAKNVADVETKEVKTDAEKLMEENAELKKMLEELSKKQQVQPQVIVTAPETARVEFLWMADVADENVVRFGEGGMYGQITGQIGTFSVPKNELSRVMTSSVRNFLKKRWLIVLSGMSQEEREANGVDYKEGELLDRSAFSRLIELDKKVVEIYPTLCDGHKEMVARRFNEAFDNKKHNLKREVVYELYEVAKKFGREKDFSRIVNGLSPAAVEE